MTDSSLSLDRRQTVAWLDAVRRFIGDPYGTCPPTHEEYAAFEQAYWKDKGYAAWREYMEELGYAYDPDQADPRDYPQLARELRKYRLTPELYNILLDGQGHVCAICERPTSKKTRRLAVDHDHTTGNVRGLLCGSCNVGLGNFQDSPDSLRKAADYLEFHAQATCKGKTSRPWNQRNHVLPSTTSTPSA